MIIGPLLLELGLENKAVAATGARAHPSAQGACRRCAAPSPWQRSDMFSPLLTAGAFIVLVSDTSVAAQFALLGLLTSADAWRLFGTGYLGTSIGQSVCDVIIRKTGRSSVVRSRTGSRAFLPLWC